MGIAFAFTVAIAFAFWSVWLFILLSHLINFRFVIEIKYNR